MYGEGWVGWCVGPWKGVAGECVFGWRKGKGVGKGLCVVNAVGGRGGKVDLRF